MRFIKLLLVPLCMVLCQSRAFSQKDYVITAKNDTVHCKIKMDAFDHIYAYRAAKGDQYAVIEHKNIKQVFLARDSGKYVFKELPGQFYATYVRVLEEGPVGLYEEDFKGENILGDKSIYWFLGKGAEPLVQIKSNVTSSLNIGTAKEAMKAFIDKLSDCSYVAAELKYADLDKNYDFEVIRNFIRMYNTQCPGK